MKKLVLSAFVLGGLMFTSCKDDDNIPQNELKILPTKMVSKTIYDEGGYDETITKFTYDAENRLVKMVDEENELDEDGDSFNYKTEYTFEYNGSELSKIIEKESNTVTEYTFAKTSSKITVNIKEDADTRSFELLINDKGFLLSDEDAKYSYDAKGNIIKVVDGFSQATYKYDDKNGVIRNMNLPQWVFAGIIDSYAESYINNAIYMKVEVPQYPQYNDEFNINYEYNSEGYPISAQGQSSSSSHTLTVQYNK